MLRRAATGGQENRPQGAWSWIESRAVDSYSYWKQSSRTANRTRRRMATAA